MKTPRSEFDASAESPDDGPEPKPGSEPEPESESESESESRPEPLDISDETWQELRGIAEREIDRIRGPVVVDPSSVVQEAYLKVAGKSREDWKSRSHFFASAVLALRSALIDLIRKRVAKKRGGGREPVSISVVNLFAKPCAIPFLELDEILERLVRHSSRQALIVRLHTQGRMTLQEIADLLGISLSTVEAEWRHARAWLRRELKRLGLDLDL